MQRSAPYDHIASNRPEASSTNTDRSDHTLPNFTHRLRNRFPSSLPYLPIHRNIRSALERCNLACSSTATISTLTHQYGECENFTFPFIPNMYTFDDVPSYMLTAALQR